MASLQARHQRDCAIVVARTEEKRREGKTGKASQWTTFADATKAKGCTCVPLYHVVHRANKELIREPVGHNRKEAERALDARRGHIATRTYRVLRDITFEEWSREWLAASTVKENTGRVYEDSLAYGRQAFGGVKVRDLGPDDISRFLDLIRRSRSKPISEATLAKHLRQLGACLQAAIPTYAAENPVRLLHKSMRPRPAKSKPVYFTSVELARLWPALAYRPVMLALCKIAVGTGARFGELAALRWEDVDLLNRELRVGRTFVEGIGETTPKSGEARTIDLTPPAAAVLEAWFAESGGEGLVFERDDEPGRHMTSGYVLQRVVYPALGRAGIAREGEHGRKRDFHSFRHTFARLALEGGAEITWVQRQLGHSSITLTVDLYGEWSRAAQKAQAKKLAKAFKL
jgi:integrase